LGTEKLWPAEDTGNLLRTASPWTVGPNSRVAGLVRSAGGDTTGLLGRKKEDRESGYGKKSFYSSSPRRRGSIAAGHTVHAFGSVIPALRGNDGVMKIQSFYESVNDKKLSPITP